MKNKSHDIEIYSDLGAFIEATKDWLEENETENNLIAGLSYALKNQTIECKKPLLLTLNVKDEIQGIVIQTPPNFILLSHMSESAMDALALFLVQHGFNLPGARGPEVVMPIFAKYWTQYSGVASQYLYGQKIYELTEVSPPKPVPGQLELADQADFKVARKWLEAFYGESVGGHDKVLHDVDETAHRKIRQKELFLWEVDGVPVSMSGIVGSTKNGVRISNVYTPAEHRGKGYASNCVAAVANKMLNSSFTKCYLYADRENSTSNAIYQQIGFKYIEDSISISFK